MFFVSWGVEFVECSFAEDVFSFDINRFLEVIESSYVDVEEDGVVIRVAVVGIYVFEALWELDVV